MPPFIHLFIIFALFGSTSLGLYNSLELRFFQLKKDTFAHILGLIGQKDLKIIEKAG